MGRRVTPATILLHARRQCLYDALRTGPRSLTQLASAADCSTTTALYHLDKMRLAGLVTDCVLPKKRMFALAKSVEAQHAEAVRVLKDAPLRALLKQIREKPGICMTELQEAGSSLVPESCQRLEHCRLIERHAWGNDQRCFSTQLGLRVLSHRFRTSTAQ